MRFTSAAGRVESPGMSAESSASGGAAGGRAITLRAVVIGVFFGSLLAAVGYLNDSVLNMPTLAMNYFPLAVYGALLLALLTINPLLKRLWPRAALRGGEWAVVLCIVLGSACLSSRGLMRTFLPALAAPAKHFDTNVTWETRYHLLDYVPKGMLVCDGKLDGNGVIERYLYGSPTGEAVELDKIPWDAWAGPLKGWLPVVYCIFLGALALAVVVHRQWAKRELLRFPIAEFTSTMIHGRLESTIQVGSSGSGVPILKRKGFWIVFGLAFAVHLCNGLQTWYPTMIHVPLTLNTFWGGIWQKWPALGKTGLAWVAYNGHIFLAVVGFSFFLTREVSLSVGLAPMVHELFMLVMLDRGINPRGASDVGMYEGHFNLGALLGIAWAIFWAGRAYYLPLFSRAVVPRKGRPLEGLWAARFFLIACAAAVYFLHRLGIHWSFGVVLVGATMLIQLVIARINVETGLYFYTHMFGPNQVLAGMLGLHALGPQGILLAAMFTVVVGVSSTMQVIPLIINGLEVARRQGVPTQRVAPLTGGMIALAIPIAIVVILSLSYNRGAMHQEDKHGPETAAATPFKNTVTAVDKLIKRDQLAESEEMTIWQRWANMSPPRVFVILVAVGFGLTFLFNALRQRLPWWPIHPIVLAIWGAYPLAWFGFSFLIGWAIRTIVVKLFGEQAAHRAKPMMIGLVAGDFVGLFLWLVVGWVYYGVTGKIPKTYGFSGG